ncbi:Expansin-like EG45 domain-containing protein, partial [Psidium guajava]
MIAAASNKFWQGGADCRRKYSVACTRATDLGDPHPCTGKLVMVKIVDYCLAGRRGTIDLLQEAFASIAHPDAGK